MRKLTSLLIFTFLVFSCTREEKSIINLNNNTITALGHGGMGIGNSYPMNSIESIKNCLSLGADGTEIDVQMTKDGVLVAFYDQFLDQSTNGSGQIYAKNWDEISNTIYTSQPYTRYQLVSLDELFSSIPNLSDYTFFLDCKAYNPDTSAAYRHTFTAALTAIIDKYNLKNNVNIELKRIELIKSLKTLRPDLNIFVYSGFEEALAVVNELKLDGITIAVDKISREQVNTAHQNGTMISVFNTHTKSRNIDAINKNVDFIQTDRVKHLVRLLK